MIDAAAFTAWLLNQGPAIAILVGSHIIMVRYFTSGKLHPPSTIEAKNETIAILKEANKAQEASLKDLTSAVNKVADQMELQRHRGRP